MASVGSGNSRQLQEEAALLSFPCAGYWSLLVLPLSCLWVPPSWRECSGSDISARGFEVHYTLPSLLMDLPAKRCEHNPPAAHTVHEARSSRSSWPHSRPSFRWSHGGYIVVMESQLYFGPLHTDASCVCCFKASWPVLGQEVWRSVAFVSIWNVPAFSLARHSMAWGRVYVIGTGGMAWAAPLCLQVLACSFWSSFHQSIAVEAAGESGSHSIPTSQNAQF